MQRGPIDKIIVKVFEDMYTPLRPHTDEGVEMEADALSTLAKVSRGDLRRAITSLQSAVRLKVQCQTGREEGAGKGGRGEGQREEGVPSSI